MREETGPEGGAGAAPGTPGHLCGVGEAEGAEARRGTESLGLVRGG